MRKLTKNTLIAFGLAASSLNAAACGPEPFIGQLCTFAYNFCPRGWAATEGQLLSIASNTALFSLLGTNFGGDGRTTFGLPDLRGRAVIGPGQGVGLSNVFVGEQGGSERVTLTSGNLPAHVHPATTTITATMRGTNSAGTLDTPGGNVMGKYARTNIYSASGATVNMGASAIATTANTAVGPAGSNIPFDNRQPYLGMTTCIALQGIFPSRD